MKKIRIALLSVVATGVLFAVAVPAMAHTSRSAATITVTGTEFKFKLSATSVAHGTVTFKFVNAGALSHDFSIDGKKTAVIGPKKSATLTVKFAKAGKFAYLCTVPGHAAAGMKGTLTVT